MSNLRVTAAVKQAKTRVQIQEEELLIITLYRVIVSSKHCGGSMLLFVLFA